MDITIIGAGRAGRSFAGALRESHHVDLLHHDEVSTLVEADLVLVCVPDDAVASCARRLVIAEDTVVAHVAGALGLDVLVPHARRASVHPLAVLSDPVVGATRLRGATFAVAGDPRVRELVTSLGGRAIEVAEEDRVLYHATAVAAANHLVALCAHVEVLAHGCGLDLDDLLALSGQALEDVGRVGPADALTGPAARGDEVTLAAHAAVVPELERPLHEALSARARRLARESVSCDA